jgi:hypothetical protein
MVDAKATPVAPVAPGVALFHACTVTSTAFVVSVLATTRASTKKIFPLLEALLMIAVVPVGRRRMPVEPA